MAVVLGLALQISRLFERQELQTINKRFETRPWLLWSAASLARLDPKLLWQYHEQHEFPRVWYNWDFTLSWLLENNHPPVQNNIVIFNRMLEDEPPDQALDSFPWMAPLTKYPLPRKTVAEMVDFLAGAGAAGIILDNDFPQHADGDADIAAVIDKWTSGKNGRRRVPIFMVETVNSSSDSRLLELGTPTRPVGILAELQRLQPGTEPEAKFLGTTCVSQDSDQVVRGIFINREVAGKSYRSIVVRMLEALGKPVPRDLPEEMDIDFICPPRSDLYPTRSLTYLLDPERKKVISQDAGSDVHVRGAIVFIGDGITDVYSTAYTSDGNNQMAGTEILAQALDTICRHSWPIRPTFAESLIYTFCISLIAGAFWVQWKAFQLRSQSSRRTTRKGRVLRLAADMIVLAVMLSTVYFLPCFIFIYCRWLVPMFVPTIAVGCAALAAIILEREQEREERFQVELKAAEEKLELTREKYEAEIRSREAEAQAREILVDKKRRHEFVRRINHDLNAPVSVLNWTVSELQMMELQDEKARNKVARLVKSSDKLCELIDQLVQSYDYETVPNQVNTNAVRCDLATIMHDCVDGQIPHATMNGASLEWTKPDHPLWVRVNQLELTRVIDNLIRNAVKHNPEGTRVSVSVESNGRFHTISIADNGKGIAPEHLERIFEPGYRVEPNNKKGQGLGLDIAKTLIEGMGGEISVTSTVRKGTTFKLKIPMCEEDGESSRNHGSATQATCVSESENQSNEESMVLADGTIEKVSKASDGNGNN